MSNFEISQLQFLLRKAYTDNRRLEIGAMMKQSIFYSAIKALKKGHSTFNGITQFHAVDDYIKSIPDVDIPKHVDFRHADDHLGKFNELHGKWLSDDNDETFNDFLQKVSEITN